MQWKATLRRFGVADVPLRAFSCALRRRILLQVGVCFSCFVGDEDAESSLPSARFSRLPSQGRLYVTQTRVAFFSPLNDQSLFGLQTVLVFDLKEVKALQ